jgi:hypothetical protein
VADIVLINPGFEVSFWGMEYTLPLLGKRENLPVAALPLLAASPPEGHAATLIDESVEPIDFDRCARADIVGVIGTSVQRYRMTEILTKLFDPGHDAVRPPKSRDRPPPGSRAHAGPSVIRVKLRKSVTCGLASHGITRAGLLEPNIAGCFATYSRILVAGLPVIASKS